MATRAGPVRTCVAPVAAALCLALAGCSSDASSSSANGPTSSPSAPTSGSTSAPTSAPTASTGPVIARAAAQRMLHRAVLRMQRSGHLLIATDIQFGDRYRQQARGRYEVAGHRYEGTVAQLTGKKRSGFEVFHHGDTTVLRLLSGTRGCWWQATGSPAASYAAPIPPQLAALLGARATGGRGKVLTGSLPEVPVSHVLESPAALRRDGFAPLPGSRVAGVFVIRHGVVAEFRTTVARVLLSGGVNPPPLNGADGWAMAYSLGSSRHIVDPPADQIVHVKEDDPRRAKLVAACTARSR